MGHSDLDPAIHDRRPWNAGKNVGPKRPLKPRHIWAIRFYLDEHRRLRDRALFDLAIDSKLRGCDLVKIRIGESHGNLCAVQILLGHTNIENTVRYLGVDVDPSSPRQIQALAS